MASDEEYISCEEEYSRVRPVMHCRRKRDKRQINRQNGVESESISLGKMLNALSESGIRLYVFTGHNRLIEHFVFVELLTIYRNDPAFKRQRLCLL